MRVRQVLITVYQLHKSTNAQPDTVIRILRKADQRGVMRGTAIELTFSIALLSHDRNTCLLVSSFEKSDQTDTMHLASADATKDSDNQSTFALFSMSRRPYISVPLI